MVREPSAASGESRLYSRVLARIRYNTAPERRTSVNKLRFLPLR